MLQMNTLDKLVVPLLVIALFAVTVSGCGGGSSRAPQAVAPAQHRAPSDVVYPADTYLLGDMDGDGQPSVSDAIKILRIVVGLDDPDPRADVNQDGSTDIGDAIKVLRCVVGLDTWPIATGVDPDGGTVTAAGGDVSLEFPAGAVSEDFVPAVAATTSYPDDPDIVPETVYEFGPPGTQFAEPVQVTVAYDAANIPAGLEEDDLRLCKVVDSAWEAVAGSSVDTTAKTVTGQVDSFSIYGAGAKAAAAGYVFVTAWGLRDSLAGQFAEPHDVAVDSVGNVYVADISNDRIQKFTSDGAFLGWWGRGGHWEGAPLQSPWVDETTGWHGPDSGQIAHWGDGDGQFNLPSGVAVDSVGKVYVADLYNDRIQKFTSDGTFLGWWGRGVYPSFYLNEGTTGWHGPGSDQVGYGGSGDGQFIEPWGVAVDGAGNVYVADTTNDRIQKFTSHGAFLTKWGLYGSDDRQFDRPFDVAVDAAGNVYVADCDNYRIQKFTSEGTFLTKWGPQGSGDGQFEYPVGVAADADGNVYVADTGNCRIQKLTSEGTFIGWWGQGESVGTHERRTGWFGPNSGYIPLHDIPASGDGQFEWAVGVAVDADGNMYVADRATITGNPRIQKFRPVAP